MTLVIKQIPLTLGPRQYPFVYFFSLSLWSSESRLILLTTLRVTLNNCNHTQRSYLCLPLFFFIYFSFSLSFLISTHLAHLLFSLDFQVESALKFCDYVDNICVHGDSFHNNVIALITPNRKQISILAQSLGKDSSLSFNQLCTDEDIINEVKKSLAYHGSRCGLLRLEIPTDIKLCSEDWLPDNGLVTASLKVRRKQIEEFYKQDIIRLYSSQSSSSKSTWITNITS